MCSLIVKIYAKFCVKRVNKEDINTLKLCPPTLTRSNYNWDMENSHYLQKQHLQGHRAREDSNRGENSIQTS